MVAQILLLGVAVLFALGPAASACQSTRNPVLDDNFKTPDPGWGRPDNIANFTGSGLALTPPVNGSAWRINQNYKLATADWCVEVANPARLPVGADQQTVGDVGVWFWGHDGQNFYTATLALDGSIAVDRLVGGKWQTVVPPTPSAAVKTAAGASNEIEIIVRGTAGALFVNGARAADFRGQPPPDGGSPGVYGESGPTGTSWLFTRTRLF